MNALAFIFGLFVGSCAGVFVMAIMRAAADDPPPSHATLLTALRDLHANMQAQDRENEAERPTEEDYRRCMHAAAVAIAQATGSAP